MHFRALHVTALLCAEQKNKSASSPRVEIGAAAAEQFVPDSMREHAALLTLSGRGAAVACAGPR